MNKFEAGDKVRCVEVRGTARDRLTQDKAYEVLAAREWISLVRDDVGVASYFSNTFFEKVEDQTDSEEIKAGDVVECVDADNALHYLVKGGHYFVDAIREGLGGAILYDVSSLQDGSKGSGWAPHRFKKIAWEEVTTDTKSEETQVSELDEFKARVWEAAQEAKKEHGWCSEVDALLAGLGVTDPNPRAMYRVMIPVEISAPRAEGKDAIDLVRSAAVGAVHGALIEFAESDVSVERVKGRPRWTVEEVTG